MARLEVEIGGSTSGLGQAANQALGILNNLQKAADDLKIKLFKAEDVATMNATGGALVAVTSRIKDYTNAAIKGSEAFHDNQTAAILDTLSIKLNILNGNVQLFGSSVKNQQSQIKAYETAINKLIQNGFSPFDNRVIALKNNIEALNATIAAGKTSALADQFKTTGQIIPDIEAKIKRLKTALSGAVDERSITQYNIRLRTAQVELDRLRNLGLQATKTNTGLTSSLNAQAIASRRVAGSYNSVGLELGRVIQDAPFAANNFGAIGNNITRLVEVVPGYVGQLKATIIAQGGVATSGNILKAGLVGIFTGFAGLSLVISAAVTAYTFYQQSQQKTKREQDKLNGSTQNYIETLRAVQRSQLEGAQAAQSDLTNLRLLFKVYQDANIPIEQRRDAYKQLQQLYPEYFANIAFEQKATAATKKAYDLLTGSIIASAKARAAANLITKNSERQLENESKLIKLRAKEEKLQADLLKEKNAELIKSQALTEGSGSISALQDISRAQDALNENIKIQNNLKTDSSILTKENIRLEKETIEQIKKRGTLVDLNKPAKGKKAPVDRSDVIVQRGANFADISNLEGVDRDVEAVRQKYMKLYADLQANAKKSAEGRKTLESDISQLQANEATEIGRIIVAENIRVSEEIQRINNESGVRASEDRARELLQIQKWYDEQVIKANGVASILVAVEEGKQAQINAVNEKWIQKRLDAEQKLIDEIEKIQNKEFTVNTNNTKKGTTLIEKQLGERLKATKKHFDELRKIYAGDVLGQIAITQSEKKINAGIVSAADAAKDGGLSKEFNRAVRKFGEDFYRVLTTLNQQADQTFQGIFSTLVTGFTASMDDIFLNVFQEKFKAAINSTSSDFANKMSSAIAAVGLVGGAISGLTKQTSRAGQGIGGALSGAAAGAGAAIATGAALGTAAGPIGIAVGAGIGLLVGAISGIFKANKARKQEELQKKQLAEAEKQTKLLERQNALAYTASIIGRMTTQGVVTGVEINEFGQLSTKISGQDIVVVLDRANRSRKRGT